MSRPRHVPPWRWWRLRRLARWRAARLLADLEEAARDRGDTDLARALEPAVAEVRALADVEPDDDPEPAPAPPHPTSKPKRRPGRR